MSEGADRHKPADGGALRDSLKQANAQAALLGALAQHHAAHISKSYWTALSATLTGFAGLAAVTDNGKTADQFQTYLKDSIERWVLYVDTLRLRGNSYIGREREGFKPVLAFDYEMVMDGRELERPVNYALVRILPPEDAPPAREDMRPFVIIDPRAGHGSGIGGFKSESEVGVALNNGHPVYFVIFFPEPKPGQTLADVCHAEAKFLEQVHARHPHSLPPLVTGNCQGGWAAMILAATHPGLSGPIVIAGAPLSYWAGEVGKNPFRYLGGLIGGATPALMAADLGKGKFDGAGLVLNFEQLNPGKTWWRKYYDVFSRVDSEAGKFLEFENWWSGFYFMNEAEIRWIIENLFIGNKLTQGKAILDDGTRVDLTRIKAPVVVFASHGDNITPPQQALNWIPDLYESVDEIQARGHVIIYTLHDSVGHLGIFVSGKVAARQHKEINSVLQMIEALAPGLYEMQIRDTADGAPEVLFEARTIDDILKFDDGREEEAEFAAVAKVSEWSTRTYELTMRPALRAMVTPQVAEAIVTANPMRQQRYLLSDRNPMLAGVGDWAEKTRKNRSVASEDNPFVQMERLQADLVEHAFDLFRDMRDAFTEIAFHTLYGTPWMRAVAKQELPSLVSHEIMRFPEVKQAVENAGQGGYKEAIIRMLLLIAQARGAVRRDRLERSNSMIHSRPPFDTMTEEERADLIYQQTLIVKFAPEEAMASLPQLLKDDVERYRAINVVLDIAGPVEDMDPQTITMFKRQQTILRTLAHDWREPKQHETAKRTAPT